MIDRGPFYVQPPGDDPIPSRPDGVITLKPEVEKAAELRARARKLLIELCMVMDEGMRDGLLIRWQNIAVNAYGNHEVIDLHVMKRY